MDKQELQIQNLVRKLEILVYQVNNLENYEKKSLQDILKAEVGEELRNISLSLAEYHVIDCIERNERINTTTISQKLTITKGGISKITAKLVKKKMIEVQRLANNQKETYYLLTPLGRKIFRVHEIMHEQAERRFTTFFSAYSRDELNFASRFLADIITVFQSTT